MGLFRHCHADVTPRLRCAGRFGRHNCGVRSVARRGVSGDDPNMPYIISGFLFSLGEVTLFCFEWGSTWKHSANGLPSHSLLSEHTLILWSCTPTEREPIVDLKAVFVCLVTERGRIKLLHLFSLASGKTEMSCFKVHWISPLLKTIKISRSRAFLFEAPTFYIMFLLQLPTTAFTS